MSERPTWCPHPTCIYKIKSQDLICGGWLPKPEPHGDFGVNDRRLCIRFEDDNAVVDMQVHSGDLWTIERIVKFLREKGKHDG